MSIRENNHGISAEVGGIPAEPQRAGDGFQPRLTLSVCYDFRCQGLGATFLRSS